MSAAIVASEVPAREHESCGCLPCCRAWRASFAPRPDWPVDPESGRLLCTSAMPMPADHKGQWLHPEAKCTGCGDYTDDYECLACGASWSAELPE